MLPAITVDVGTTSVKLCMFDAAGRVLASQRHATPTRQDEWGEIYDLPFLTGIVSGFIIGLDPEHRAIAKRIAIASVGESGGLVRHDLSLASPMILWHDHRGAEHLERLTASERAEIYRVTGLPVNANYGLSKAAWASKNAGDAIDGAQWLNIAEYLAALMTRQRWSEPSLASRTMALDLRRGEWSERVCSFVGIDTKLFPDLRAASEGSLVTEEFIRETGLSSDVWVHVAGHDHMVGAVGAGLQQGELLNSTGTTEGLLFLRDSPVLDDSAAESKLANGKSCTGRDFTLFASIPTGGSAFATLQNMLGLSAERLVACIGRIHERYAAGRVDLSAIPLFVPRFRGSPPPAKRASARGLVAGLSTDTSPEDLVLGCFMGLALQFRDVLELFPTQPSRIKVIGPASANPLWLQLKADLLGTSLSVSQFPEVVSRGAQALASESPCDWEASRPSDVHADAVRHARLAGWSDHVRPGWEYLKGFPE